MQEDQNNSLPPHELVPTEGSVESPQSVSVATSLVQEEQPFAFRLLLIIAVLLGILGIMLYFLPSTPLYEETSRNTQTGEGVLTPMEQRFPHVDLEATAAYVLDLVTGEELYSKNGSSQLPLASLTKLMTVLVAADIFSDSHVVTIRTELIDKDGEHGLKPNESWLSKDLFAFTLMQSSNGAARNIASAAAALPRADLGAVEEAEERFVGLMNERAQTLGLGQTYFLNETGLDETDLVPGGYGSARDVAYLMGEMVKKHPELLEATRFKALQLDTAYSGTRLAINTNQEMGEIPGLIGSKTGYTDLAGGNLTIAFDRGIGRPIVIAVLGSTREGRFDDVKTLVDATFTYLQANDR